MDETLCRLINPNNPNPFDILYEICIAIHYSVNGWLVDVVNPISNSKTPDLRISKANQTFYIECKYLSKDSDYRSEEKKAFNALWNDVISHALEKHSWKIFNIIFKVPIESINRDEFIKDIYNICANHKYIKTDDVEISIENIRREDLLNTLLETRIQKESPRFINLVFHEFDPFSEYNIHMISGDDIIHEETSAYFVGNVIRICAVKWECISEESNEKKLEI